MHGYRNGCYRNTCWSWFAIGLLAMLGCQPRVELAYREREDTQKLPAAHQEDIRKYLFEYYGTAGTPRWMRPLPDAGAELEPVRRRDHLVLGQQVYSLRCAQCHGVTGDGNGPAAAYLLPKPRDYRKGTFKFTSTPRGSRPRRSDLARTIRLGAKGTSMPAFRWLTEQEREAVLDYVIMLSQRGQLEIELIRECELELEESDRLAADVVAERVTEIAAAWTEAEGQTVLPITHEVPNTPESVQLGRQAFMSRGCAKCHGENGKGQTEWLSPEFLAQQQSLPAEQRQQLNQDDWGQIAPAADLTAGMLHGGRRPVDIYRRIHSGINGTPMPGFADALGEEPDTIWHLVHYIMSVVRGDAVAKEAQAIVNQDPS